MKNTPIFLLVLASSLVAPPQEKALKPATAVRQNHCTVPADEAALSKIAEQWKDGYNNGHAANVAALYAEDATYLTQHFATGIVQGRAAIQAYVQRGVDARYHIDCIQVLSIVCSGNLAYTIARYESTNGGQKAFGVNLVVLKKIGGKWLIVAHESAVPDPATAIQHLDIPRGR
jgi:ketosteroid isomerase-like protein